MEFTDDGVGVLVALLHEEMKKKNCSYVYM